MSHSGKRYKGRTLVAGAARGPILRLTEPLSFWGGMDVATGCIIDHHHPQVGQCLTGTILVMPAGRGSSSSSSVLAEAIYAGTAPAAIILRETDVIVALGALVAKELYGLACPVVVLDALDLAQGTAVSLAATAGDGTGASAVTLGEA
jgi:predicted aconitase with swiveling domain